jgi:hypothetical protein
MAKRLTGLNPLSYIGVEATTPPNVYVSDSAPTSSDARNVYLGDFWLDKTTQNLYVLTSVAGGTAEWMLIIGGGGATVNFVTDSGTATESGGSINILGDGLAISTSGFGDTVTIGISTNPTFTNLTVTDTINVGGDVVIDGELILTGFTSGVLVTNNMGAVGEVVTTDNSILIGNSDGTIDSLGVATNGQIPIGSTGNPPTLGTITAGTGISVTNGAGSITLAATGSFASPVTVPNGGTGDTSFTPYAVICGGTTSTSPLQSIAGLGTAGQVLTSNGPGALPTFQNAGAASGGSGVMGASPTTSLIAAGATNYIAPFGDQKSATQADQQWAIPSAGTVSDLYVYVSANASTTDTTVTLFKNSVATTLTVTITALTTGTFSDTTHTVSVAAGDLLQWELDGATTGDVDGSIGMDFVISGGGGGGTTAFNTDSGTANETGGAINIFGAGGITTSGSGSTVTITGSGTGITWSTVSSASQALAVNHGYVVNNGTLCTLTLPASAAVGDVIYITGLGAGGWTIAQNSGQLIHFGSAVTTTGVGGSLSSTNQYNTITLVCSVTNTTFNVLSSIGNITVV